MTDADTHSSFPPQHLTFLSRCVSVDLEVNPKTAQTFALAAVPFNGGPSIVAKGHGLETGLERALERIEHPVGHNFLRHDMTHLLARRPRLARVLEAPIDTLWLNPLAFPRNPYHHLVKYH